MKEVERAFADGEVIFREGEPSRSAFVLTRGRVELVKLTEKTTTRVALLRPGDMFGELGLLDESPRATTARAVGPVLVKEVPRQEFLGAAAEVASPPSIALPSLGALMDRLRGAVMSATEDTAASPEPKAKPLSIVDRLLGAGFVSRTPAIAIMVAPLGNDMGGVATRALTGALNRRHGLKVRVAKGLPALAAGEPPPAVVAAIRKWLVQSGAEALIWGEVDPTQSLALRFLPVTPEDEDRPGYFGLGTTLILPQPMAPAGADIVAAAVFAVAVVGSESRSRKPRPEIARALATGLVNGEQGAAQLVPEARAHLEAILGHIACAAARWGRVADLHERAAKHYAAAAGALKEGLDRARVDRNLGAVRQAIIEARGGDATILAASADSYRRSLKGLSRAKFPREWASAHNRLGQVLYRMSLAQGGTDLVKESIAAFQSALSVYSRAEFPARWAEVMHDFALAAQVLGGELRSAEALEKAVEACLGALEIRTRETAPLLWAATQNNLGSALFQLGKIAKSPRHVEAAAGAFREAASLGPIAGAKNVVAAAEKNLAHVERYLADFAPRRPSRAGDAAASESE